jgi:hypothetical protein
MLCSRKLLTLAGAHHPVQAGDPVAPQHRKALTPDMLCHDPDVAGG